MVDDEYHANQVQEAQIAAVRKTAQYLIDTLTTANEVAGDHEKRLIDKVLSLLGAVWDSPEMILGPESVDVVSREKKYAARILMAMTGIIAERGVQLKQSIDLSSEMGFNMLSQQGMLGALRWVHKLCAENARGLDPSMEVETVAADSPEGREHLKMVQEAVARDKKNIDQELEEALSGS